MAPQNQRLFPIALRSIDSASFTGSYQAVGTALSEPVRIIKMYNDASVPVTISWDGTNDHDFLPSKGFILIDVSTNREVTDILEIEKGILFYVKGSAGTGSFYISAYYAR